MTASPELAPLSGLLIIDKQPGFTSMDVCAILRTRLRRGGAPKRVKVGHAGTLDPMATGVLVVLIGRATRLCDTLMTQEKEYEAMIDLAHRSDTDDAEGDVTAVPACDPLPNREKVLAALATFVGVISQRPPAFSALKVGGRRAYALARDGRAPVLQARPVTIHELTLLDYSWPLARVHVRCGKGTYIRSLARDLGEALAAGGMLTALRRTRVGSYDIATAKRLDQLPDVLTQTDLLPPPTGPEASDARPQSSSS